MAYKRIPKGYFSTEYPLPHNFETNFSLSVDDTSTNFGTHVIAIMNDLGLVSPDLVIANPEHASFAEVAYAQCHKNSIIDNFSIRIRAKMSKGAIETDGMRDIYFYILPVYTAFKNRLDAADIKTGTTVASIMEISSEDVGKSVVPIYNNVNLSNASVLNAHANTTVPLLGMTTDRTLQSITFDTDLFWDAIQYFTNAPMLRQIAGKMMRFHLTRDRGISIMMRRLKGMIKRINEYTFCGFLIFAGKAGDKDSMHLAGDVTAISHITFRCDIRYDEWNSEFDQTSS